MYESTEASDDAVKFELPREDQSRAQSGVSISLSFAVSIWGNLERRAYKTRLLLRVRLLKPASQCTSRYIASPSKADLTGVPSLLSRTARSRLRELA